ncbi:uncharacterized protein LOC117324871 [Pecten maximus]|uniref:uncharacterized protein LOC117324871 n=1 Tax=Pecten maximus TaxID=6579 RepID=UPI0014587491|nr:uncharacterized protein LOC117324871 [Pecten maximus]
MRKDGSSQVRRQLDFREKILTQRTFYIDIREEDLRKRITRRVKDLGGQVEDFLSKDVNILLTDSNNTAQKICPTSLTPNASPDPDTKVAVPLSRGKALLLKAKKQSSCQQSTKGTDIVQNALNLGVKVEKAKDFLKSTHKYAQKLKQVKALQSDGIDGITPLQWKNSDKENFIVLKVEDDKQVYRPFLKHFKDSFPKIRYGDDLASPFDKGVTLCRTVENRTKNRYSTKGKPSVASSKGGFCEACDYWYRCSLREHLSSMKHQKFVQTNTNFKQLDQIINKMPNIQDFMSKFNLDYARSAEVKQTQILSEKLDAKCSTEGVDNCKTAVETFDTLMEMSASPRSLPTVRNDGGSVLSNCAMVISPVAAEPVNINCDTDMTMEVDISYISGTGPEIQEDISIPCDFVQSVCSNQQVTEHVIDEDSAFQHDQTSNDMASCENTTGNIVPNSTLSQSMNSVFSPSIDSENAMFLDLTVKKDNMPVQEVTSNVRKKLSAIVIADNILNQSERIHTHHYDIEKKKKKEPSSFSFAGLDNFLVSSPIHHNSSPKSVMCGRKLDFANIAADWMKDMSQTQEQQNQETPKTSTKKKMSSRKSKKHSSVQKRKKKSKNKSLTSKENDWPFSLFNTKSCDSSDSDLELPQLPVLNSNIAKQRLIEEERKLQSSPIQYCSRQLIADQRATSTCTKKRVKLIGRHHSKSLGFKRLAKSPTLSNPEGLRNIQTKMPQYFRDKSSCNSTSAPAPMVLSPPQLSHFNCFQIQQTVRPQSCPILSPVVQALNNVNAQKESQLRQILDSQSNQYGDPSSQTLPYSQLIDHIPGTPRDSAPNSMNFTTPTNLDLDNYRTEELDYISTSQAFVSQCESKNSPSPGKENAHREFNTPQKPDNVSEYGSDTEAYIPYSPVFPVSELEQQQSGTNQAPFLPLSSDGCDADVNKSDHFDRNSDVRSYASDKFQTVSTNKRTSNCSNTLDQSTTLVKSCSELSFSVESILSGRTGKKRTVSGDPEIGAASPSSLLHSDINMIVPTSEPKNLLPSTTEKKKRKRKRHASKNYKDSGCQYYVCPQEGTKIKLCRVMVTPMEQKNNLKTFWKVTKAGSCRLVFSAEKNKGMNNSDIKKRDRSCDQVQSSKRRKLVY